MPGSQRKPRWFAAALLAVACCALLFEEASGQAASDAEEEAWVTDEDRKVAADAKVAVGVYCDGGFKGDVDREASRQVLEDGVGSSNIMLEILTEAESNSDLADKAAKKITPMWLFWKVGALVMCFLLALLWWFCCWTVCPCCKCCRCCARERKTPFLAKITILVAGGALTFGIIFSASYAMVGYDAAVDGFDNMACTSAKLLNGTLSGRSNPYFLGMMPILEIFKGLEESLASDSQIMTDVVNTLDLSVSVTDSVTIAQETLRLVRDAISTNFPPEIEQKHHSCEFCTGLILPLNFAVNSLNSGITKKLSDARVEVKTQLSPENSAVLRQTFSSAAEPLKTVKSLVRDVFSFFTDTEKFLQVRGHLTGEGEPQTLKYFTALIIVLSLAISGCMNISFITFFLCERRGQAEADAPKPYSKIPHRNAGLTWCCGWWFAIMAFFFAGLMTAMGVPLSGMCLIMDDLSPQMLQDIAPAVDFNISGDQGEQALGIIDKCLVPADRTLNAMLLDLLWVRNETTGVKETLREQIVENLKDQIRSAFSAIDDVGSQNATLLANDPKVLAIREMLQNPIDMMIFAGPTDIQWLTSSPDYAAMFSQSGLQENAPSSVRCSSGAMTAGFGNQSVIGVEEFVTALSAFGTRNVLRADCADTVICADVVSSPRREACDAGNKFVTLKQNIMDLTNFQCDVFLDPQDGVSDCDPLSMTGTFNSAIGITEWTGGCLMSDGTMVRKSKPCTLPQFTAYIQSFDARIAKAVQRIDTAASEVGPAISDTLRQIVEDNVLVPIDIVADGVTCGFLSDFYREMVDGFCYQGIYGFRMISQSYSGCAVLTLFVVLLSYGLWRRAIDNTNSVDKTDVVIMTTDGVPPSEPKEVP